MSPEKGQDDSNPPALIREPPDTCADESALRTILISWLVIFVVQSRKRGVTLGCEAHSSNT